MSSEAVTITEHITHTNNTLILGRLNSDENAPSLIRALSDDDMGAVINAVYEGDDTEKLAVKEIGDVTRIFKPTYFFSIDEESVDGIKKMVVNHSLKRRENGLPVEITPESLCFRILESKGRFDVDEIVSVIRTNLSRGRDNYLKAVKSRNPARIKAQEKMRHDLISQLLEPVVSYLIVAESTVNYRIIEGGEEAGKEAKEEKDRHIWVLVPEIDENGNFTLARKKIRVPPAPDFKVDDLEDDSDFIPGTALENDIRMGRKYLAAAVEGQLKFASNESNLTEAKKQLVEALVESGVASELMIDDLGQDSTARNLLTGKIDTFLLEHDQLLLEGGQEQPETSYVIDTDVEAEPGEKEPSPPSQNLTLAPIQLSKKLRDNLQNDKLKKDIQLVETVALTYFSDDAKKQEKISNYLHTLTPVGQIKNEFAEINYSPNAKKKLYGEIGLGIYFKLCLEEAAERSVFVKRFKELLLRALLKKEFPVEEEKEKEWQEFHDHLLDLAQAAFADYMTKVSPLVSQLKGIDAFLKTSKAAKDRKPRVLVANMNVREIMDDQDLKDKFENFISALDDVHQENFERAISIAIIPKMEEFYKDDFLEIASRVGFAAFFSPEEPVEFNDLNDTEKIKELTDIWSSTDSEQHSSGVLCVPDIVLLPSGFTFRLGEELVGKKTVNFKLEESIVVPICFTAAALVARNDDYAFVRNALKGSGLKFEPKWPCIGIGVEPQTRPLWESDVPSEGVILEKNLEKPLPLCVFEHSKNEKGKPNKQRIRHLNSLYMFEDRPVSIHDYRVAIYLSRVLKKTIQMRPNRTNSKLFALNPCRVFIETM